MEHWGVSILIAAALLTGCAAPSEPPMAEPEQVVTTISAAMADPAPAPVVTLGERIKQEGWLVRFWEQLTPSQRRRVTVRLRQHSPPMAKDETDAAPIWDSLGLPERDALIFVGRLPRPSGL